MQSKKKNKAKNKRSKILIPLLVILILAGAGGGYWYWNQTQLKKAESATAAANTTKTAQVRNGSILLSASGSGTLIAGQQTALSFSASGTVAEVSVKVGDAVKKDQVLAKLDNLNTLQTAIHVAQQNLISAQTAMQTLKQNAAANIANAQLALATAQKAVLDAKSKLVQKGMARCDQETMDLDYQKFMLAQDHLNQISAASDGSNDYYVTYVLPAKDAAAQAYSVYVWCTGFTSYEVDSSSANVALSAAQLKTAQDTLDTLTKNNGIDPLQLLTAQNKIDNAQLALDNANQALAGAAIKAPYDGVILTVAGLAGSNAGTGTFITIADLSHPQIQFSIDEADMSKLALDEKATVSFDAIPKRTFNAKVTQINPALQTVSGYKVVQGTAVLELSAEKDMPVMATGMNASIQIISAEAKNVVLVPIQALRSLGEGQYAVFVMTNGQPKLRSITVGLMDTVNAEVKTGLKAGETVTTGVAQVTNNAASGNGN